MYLQYIVYIALLVIRNDTQNVKETNLLVVCMYWCTNNTCVIIKLLLTFKGSLALFYDLHINR